MGSVYINLNEKIITEKFIIEEYINGSGHGISFFVKDSKIIRILR